MASSDLPSGEDGPSTARPSLRRRYSMEEDLYYQHIMATSPRRPSNPPMYELSDPLEKQRSRTRDAQAFDMQPLKDGLEAPAYEPYEEENLPDYSTAIQIEGVFSKKHEIEYTTKRAEDRQWHTVRVALTGTALNIYKVKKDWGWGKSRDGPSISPDNPPWIKKAKLEKSYNLLHADAGIAADYHKRRYVIRIRAETDQFLLACVELETFVKWLELLFAAIDVTAPLDDRDFPRDMSIPRVQRIRWFRNVSPVRDEHSRTDPEDESSNRAEPQPQQQPQQQQQQQPQLQKQKSQQDQISQGRRPSQTNSTKAVRGETASSLRHESIPEPEPIPNPDQEINLEEEVVDDEASHDEDSEDEDAPPPPRIDPAHRFSTTSYPNMAIDPFSGKWFPEHKWSSAHDLLYAKLCYSNLLFRSPRKSNYIIQQGKQWFVDWTSGKMVRVLPPNYGEINDFFGPWQVIHTENRRI